jgi:hypothetical protein
LTILPPWLANDRIDSGAVLPKRPCRAGLIDAHQPAIAGHIGGQDGSKSAFDAALPRSGHGAALSAGILHRPGV